MRINKILDYASVAVIGGVLSSAVFGADLVEFHIKAGTGNSPWNTRETAVDVKVGQTLRIINDDSTPHRLHTSGSPCPHQPKNSLTGEFYDCKISSVADPDVDKFYDHNVGSAARFYLRATN